MSSLRSTRGWGATGTGCVSPGAGRGAQARGKSAIIFIDELEVLGGKRGKHSSHLEYDQTLNQLLVEMDGLTVSEHEVLVLVVGATNRADLLDEALLRPGRFDRVVRVELPDKTARYQIITLHVRNKPLAEDVDLHEIARQTFGFSGAHLESVANEAAILARRAGKGEIGQTEFIEAIEKVMLGERIDRQPSQSELRRVAFHEGGHALVGGIEARVCVQYQHFPARYAWICATHRPRMCICILRKCWRMKFLSPWEVPWRKS